VKAKLDIVVAPLASSKPQPLATPLRSFDQVFASNERWLGLHCEEALPLLNGRRRDHRHRVDRPQQGLPGFTAYSATKAAVRSFVRTWTAELKDRRIRVNTISPGPIDTRSSTNSLPPRRAPTRRGSVRDDRPVRPDGAARRDRRCRAVSRIRRSELHRRRGSPGRRRYDRSLIAVPTVPAVHLAVLSARRLPSGRRRPTCCPFAHLMAKAA